MARVDLRTAVVTEEWQNDFVALAVTATSDERLAAIRQARNGGQSIAVPFARFNDGRGFSLARLLRREHRYDGEIVATGHTIPDQAVHLLRSGFDAVEVANPARLPQWQRWLEGPSGSRRQLAAHNPLATRREAISRASATPHVSSECRPRNPCGDTAKHRAKEIA